MQALRSSVAPSHLVQLQFHGGWWWWWSKRRGIAIFHPVARVFPRCHIIWQQTGCWARVFAWAIGGIKYEQYFFVTELFMWKPSISLAFSFFFCKHKHLCLKFTEKPPNITPLGKIIQFLEVPNLDLGPTDLLKHSAWSQHSSKGTAYNFRDAPAKIFSLPASYHLLELLTFLAKCKVHSSISPNTSNFNHKTHTLAFRNVI